MVLEGGIRGAGAGDEAGRLGRCSVAEAVDDLEGGSDPGIAEDG